MLDLLARFFSRSPPPDEDAEACKRRGNESLAKGHVAEAAAHYREAIGIAPDFAEAYNNLGLVLLQQGSRDEAMALFGRAISLAPDLAQAHLNRANVFNQSGLIDEALDCLRTALEFAPDFADAHCNLGVVLQAQGKTAEALASYLEAIRLKPSSAEAHYNLGDLLQEQGKLVDARSCYERAIRCNTEFAEAHNSLGIVLRDLGQLEEAAACFERALALKAGFPAACNNLGTLALDRGEQETAYAYFRQALAADPDNVDAFSNFLFAAQYDARYSSAELHAEHRRFGEHFEPALRANWPMHGNLPDAGRRLRVGFVSGDLRVHPVGHFMEGVLAHLDRQAFDIVLYPTLPRTDELSVRLQGLDLGWHPLSGLSDAAAAKRILDDGIDILVDLSGHTAGHRLLVFARKPAPIQASWLYFSTTGLQAMDYVICDQHVIPGPERQHFVEKPWYLPDCYLCFTPPREQVPTAAPPVLDCGYVTFGCFNNLVKLNDTVVGAWARVLEAVPQSKLFLKAGQLKDAGMQRSVRVRFAAHGIDPSRLVLEGPSPRAEYLASYNRMDIALDPFPFPGGTTTVEALWMGVPVLTRCGQRFISHAGESILRNTGLPDWVARDTDDYVAKATAFASDPAALAMLRAGLRDCFLASPLCDAQRFASHLGSAFRGMWKAYVAGSGATAVHSLPD